MGQRGASQGMGCCRAALCGVSVGGIPVGDGRYLRPLSWLSARASAPGATHAGANLVDQWLSAVLKPKVDVGRRQVGTGLPSCSDATDGG